MAEAKSKIAFNEGINAALAGKAITDCPYCAPLSEWAAWIAGFNMIKQSQ